MQDFLQFFADWVTYSILGLVQNSPLASSVNFFVYDSIKVTVMLAVIVFSVAIIRYYHPAESEEMGRRAYEGWATS